MGWIRRLFGRGGGNKRTPVRTASAKLKPTSKKPANQPLSRGARLKRLMQFRALREWNAARRERIAKMSPKERAALRNGRILKTVGAAGLATAIGLAVHLRSRHDGPAAHPTLIERPITNNGGVEIVSPVRNGDEGARVEVKPLPGETRKKFEQRVEEWRDVLEPTERRPPIRIGKFLLIPGEIELDALRRDGSLKEVQDSLGLAKPLEYDLSNVKPVEFDAEKHVNTYGFDRKVPPGSLLRVNVADERGNVFTTYMLMEENGFVYYSYPPGVYGSHDNRQSTGFTGGIDNYLPPNAWVSGYIPPKE